MNITITDYIVLVIISGVLSVLLAIYAYFMKTNFSGTKAFIWSSAFSAIYTFAFVFELSSDSLQEIRFWLNIEYLGLPFIAPSSLLLVLHYIGREKFAAFRRGWVLFVIPAITLIMNTTNDYHRLFYKVLYLRENTPTPMIDIFPGRWYFVHGAYTFGCLLVSIFLLVVHTRKSSSVYRKQNFTMILGHLLPMLGALFYVLGMTPLGMDPVPIVMCVTSALYIWAIVSTGMLTVAPIARDHIFESMRDGVLVLDLSGKIFDYNSAAIAIIPSLSPAAIGKTIEQVWKRGADTGVFEGDLNDTSKQEYEHELKWIKGGETYYYRVRSSKLLNTKGEIAGRTIVMIDMTEHMQLQNKLRRLAEIDGLTGIYNRTHFMEIATEQLRQARINHAPLALILIDIDFFKSINDRFGHSVGDLAIHHVVSLVKSIISPETSFARYGGEEFVLCVPDTALGQALQTAEQLRQKIASTPLISGSHAISITASFGVTEAYQSALPLESLLHEADDALYFAKRNGRNRVIAAGSIEPQSESAATVTRV
ncbi:histidine kinase N-terminal 7TM domain-containing diguanylate cyclase [Paenibacillus harenae]|uniref:histidine kinase N-terminal 7TM domain-containing diguanylate cyclase n=1 Tax=Paenibacillus harenae TaxID=306543 RepID=UPI0027902DEB|nr:histidine kinase N-terminal 7TM domain-containing protein [Paenibacillus harenae]MDQ0061819.1 diguanylate cyclase (GGDEF)-like protein/PAS domain S-box-containing protein [Paenibacillus harenae]